MSEDNLWRKIERVIRPIYLIGLFILLLFLGFAKEARSEVSVELGAALLSGQYSEGKALLLNERFGKYSVGIGYVSEQWVEPRNEPRTFVMEAIFVQGWRNVELSERWSLGIGAAWFNLSNDKSRALGGPFNFGLRVQYRFAEHWSANIQHHSNAGSKRPNMGQDLLTVGYHF